MVGFEFSCFGHHLPKKTSKMSKKGSENGVKMVPRSGNRAPGAHFVRFESIVSEKCPKKVTGDAPRRSESRAWVPLIKENIRESESGSDVRDRIRHYKKALGA